MAVDTAAKRFSIMDMGGVATMPGMPLPDGSIAQADRQHLLWLYSGILAGEQQPEPEPEPTPAVTSGSGGGRRKPEAWSLTVDGVPMVFPSLDALIAFLDSMEQEKTEAVETKAEADAQRVVLVGHKKAAPKPPQVRIETKVAEIRDYAADVQAKIDRIYWKALAVAVAREAEEEEDIKFIARLL